MTKMITKPEPYCPICGAKMVLRRPKLGQDWDPFWGCNQYPDCRGTRDTSPETGKPIPVWGARPDKYCYDENSEEDNYFVHPGNHGDQ